MQKSGFPKIRHYVGFWQIGSHILEKGCFSTQSTPKSVTVNSHNNKDTIQMYTCMGYKLLVFQSTVPINAFLWNNK